VTKVVIFFFSAIEPKKNAMAIATIAFFVTTKPKRRRQW
jgi:hypothetical protein